MKKTLKIFAAVLSLCLIFTQVQLCVFAEGELPVQLSLKAVGTNVLRYELDSYVRVNVSFDFGDEFNEANGINVFMFRLTFDPEILTLVDPDSSNHEPVFINDRGRVTAIVDGQEQKAQAFRIDDEIAQSRSVTLNMEDGSGVLTLLYSGLSADSDIFASGPVFQFWFKVTPELAIENKHQTAIKLIEPDVSVNNRDVKLDVSGDEMYIDIIPRFLLPELNSVVSQNSTFKATAWTNLSPDDGIPLMATISKDGQVYAEQEAEIDRSHYDISFDIDEETFEPGLYRLTVSYADTSAYTTFNIGKKYEEYVPPVDDPGTSDTPGGTGGTDDGKPEDKDPEKDPEKDPGKDPEKDPEKDSEKEPAKDDKSDGKSGGNGTGTRGSVTGIPTDNKEQGGNTGGEQNNGGTAAAYPNDIEGHWAIDNVKYVYDNKLMNGYDDGTFLPDSSITRAEFATVMARFMGLADNETAADVFSDVDGHWAKKYIGALYEKKIINGISESEFAPDENITREQIAVMLCRAFDIAPSGDITVFTDYAQISDWATDGVLGVYSAGYMKGDTTGAFLPLNNATRAEVATVISRIHSEKSSTK